MVGDVHEYGGCGWFWGGCGGGYGREVLLKRGLRLLDAVWGYGSLVLDLVIYLGAGGRRIRACV